MQEVEELKQFWKRNSAPQPIAWRIEDLNANEHLINNFKSADLFAIALDIAQFLS